MLRFGDHLSNALHDIKRHSGKKISAIMDELGYGFEPMLSGDTIESWRYRKSPPTIVQLETLARLIITYKVPQHNRQWLDTFLKSGDHPYPQAICDELFTLENDSADHANIYSSSIDIPLVQQSKLATHKLANAADSAALKADSQMLASATGSAISHSAAGNLLSHYQVPVLLGTLTFTLILSLVGQSHGTPQVILIAITTLGIAFYVFHYFQEGIRRNAASAIVISAATAVLGLSIWYAGTCLLDAHPESEIFSCPPASIADIIVPVTGLTFGIGIGCSISIARWLRLHFEHHLTLLYFGLFVIGGLFFTTAYVSQPDVFKNALSLQQGRHLVFFLIGGSATLLAGVVSRIFDKP